MRSQVLAGLLPAALALATLPASESGLSQVVVTNFPEVQKVVGAVQVRRPIRATALLKSKALVTPALPTQPPARTESPPSDRAGVSPGRLSPPVHIKCTLPSWGKVG